MVTFRTRASIYAFTLLILSKNATVKILSVYLGPNFRVSGTVYANCSLIVRKAIIKSISTFTGK